MKKNIKDVKESTRKVVHVNKILKRNDKKDLYFNNIKILKQWIKDLRSGKYIQTTSCLKSEYNNYCCLGVLSEQIKNYEVIKSLNWKFIDRKWKKPHYKNEEGEIPKQIMKKIGFSKDLQEELITMNDLLDFNFIEISNFLNDNILKD